MNVFEMGGYEVYVWGSVLLGLAVYGWNLLAPRLQRRRMRAELLEDGGEEQGS